MFDDISVPKHAAHGEIAHGFSANQSMGNNLAIYL